MITASLKTSVKATFDAQIVSNGNGDITGPILNSVLTALLNAIDYTLVEAATAPSTEGTKRLWRNNSGSAVGNVPNNAIAVQDHTQGSNPWVPILVKLDPGTNAALELDPATNLLNLDLAQASVMDLGDFTGPYSNGEIPVWNSVSGAFEPGAGGSGGGGTEYVDATTKSVWVASGAGVTVVKDTINGEVTVTVPEGVHLYSFSMEGTNSDTNSDDLYVLFVYENESTINQNLNTAHVPQPGYYNTVPPIAVGGGVVSRTNRAELHPNVTVKFFLTKAGLNGSNAELEIQVQNITDANWKLFFKF
jgi:hypothetical protein